MSDFKTKDGVTVKPGDFVYHPSFQASGIVSEDGKCRILTYDIRPLNQAYSNRKLWEEHHAK